MVPVLSTTTVLIFSDRSRYSAPLIRIPASAPFPTPTIRAAGVAIPIAQGQAIINTAINESNPIMKLPITKTHTIKDKIETRTTAGTNFADIESTIL